MTPTLVLEPPPFSVEVTIAPPRIAESAGAILTAWSPRRASDDSFVMVTGCVATPIPGWVEDMRPSVEGRTIALAGASAERLLGFPIDSRTDGARLMLRPSSDLASPPLGVARTFVGFDERRVFTCFATCVVEKASANIANIDLTQCERIVAAARLDDSLPPPTPGIFLRSVTWAVHHPRPTAFGAGIFVTFAGILAVATRRRPRSR